MENHPDKTAGQDPKERDPVVALAQHLTVLRDAFEKAEAEGDQAAQSALTDRAIATEDKIAETRATSLLGVLVQVLILQNVADNCSEPYDELGRGLVKNAVASLERIAEVDRKVLVGDHYGPETPPRRKNNVIPLHGGTA